MLVIKESSKLANSLGVAIVSRSLELIQQIIQDLGSRNNIEIERLWENIQDDLSEGDIQWFYSTLRVEFPGILSEIKPLSDDEQKTKVEIENRILDFLTSFFERGKDLATLKDRRLFREDYPTWEIYCRFKFGIHQTYADNLIRASDIIADLKPIGLKSVVPCNEFITRELGRVEPHLRQAVWEETVNSGEKITASSVRRAKENLTVSEPVELKEPKFKVGEILSINSTDTELKFGKVIEVTVNKRYRIKSGMAILVLGVNSLEKSEFEKELFNRLEKLTLSDSYQIKLIGQSFFCCTTIQGWQLKLLSFLEEVCL